MNNGTKGSMLLTLVVLGAAGAYAYSARDRQSERYIVTQGAENNVFVFDTKTREINMCSDKGCQLLQKKHAHSQIGHAANMMSNMNAQSMIGSQQLVAPYVKPEAVAYGYYQDGMMPNHYGMYGQHIPKMSATNGGSLSSFGDVPLGMSPIAMPMQCMMPAMVPAPKKAAIKAEETTAEAASEDVTADAPVAQAAAPEPTEEAPSAEAVAQTPELEQGVQAAPMPQMMQE